MLTLTDLEKSYGGNTLFREVSLQLTPPNRYGVVGANGSGKSTLLRVIGGDEQATSGTVSMPAKARVGVLRQDHFHYDAVPILEVVMRGRLELWKAIVEKEALLARAHEHFDGDRFSHLEDIIIRHDGYAVEARAGEVLEGLSIPTRVHHQPLSTLSGGFKLRVLLAQVLASEPDILLLDEPTNHLDILSIRWLETFLERFRGVAMVVSHDHRFLDNVSTHILDVDYERVLSYPGDYSDFEWQKVEDRERKEAQIEKNEQKRADLKAFISRFKAKASKARQAGSKAKQLDRIKIEDLPRSSRRYPSFKFKARRPSGREVLHLDGLRKAFDARPVLHDVSLRVMRGDRLAVIGPNGIGKSTLLKIMMGEFLPDAGSVQWGYETHPGYFAQDHKELLDRARGTVHDWLWDACPTESIGFVRGKLASVLFGKDDVDKPVKVLSGGEGARLVFSRLTVTQPNVLVLDEPTNHLDLEGIDALAQGLEDYEGTIIFVSHDRWFVQRLATRILELRPDGIEAFPGTYDEYLAHCGDDHLDRSS
jgi:ATPase subunit of ABC transporter with duplicated ATPase domains